MALEADRPVLRLEGVSKAFGRQRVLAGIDLTIFAGEVVAVIGPSGSGKSTLLRCMNLLEMPDAGLVEIAGIAIPVGASQREILRARRRTAMVFQQHNLFRNKTVLENVCEGPLLVQKRQAAEVRDEATALLASMGLAHKARAYPAELSGGEQQRVGIARALALKPEIILFDEPTASLDPLRSQEILGVLRQIAITGITMVVVTHEMAFARRVADRVIFMDDGRFVETGLPADLFESAADARTRQFVATLG